MLYCYTYRVVHMRHLHFYMLTLDLENALVIINTKFVILYAAEHIIKVN